MEEIITADQREKLSLDQNDREKGGVGGGGLEKGMGVGDG